jgi:outer membrane protein OmpA-like peptidoglycan-associated protein
MMGFAFRRKNLVLPRAAAPLPSAASVIQSPGRALDSSTRSLMEPRFRHDFSRVRIHIGSDAATSARYLGATAYTVGRHVVFDQGNYQPGTPQGRRLLAHELTHTIQQNEADPASAPLTVGAPSDASEREAAGAASAVAGPGHVTVNARRPVAVQRQVDPSAPPHFDLAEMASPGMARAMGSVTVDGFETGKAIIPAAGQAELATAAGTIQTLLNRYPASTISVVGHTDAVGKESDNQTLGQARADAVQESLIASGVPAEAIRTESMGATRLLVKTPNAEPRNRRVEVSFETNPHRFTKFIPDVSLTPPSPPPPPAAPGSIFKPLPDDFEVPQSVIVTPKYPYPDPPPPPSPRKGKPTKNPIESLADAITARVSKRYRGIAKTLVIGAIAKGATTGLDAGLRAAGLTDEMGLGAIETATEAAIKMRSGDKK